MGMASQGEIDLVIRFFMVFFPNYKMALIVTSVGRYDHP